MYYTTASDVGIISVELWPSIKKTPFLVTFGHVLGSFVARGCVYSTENVP